MEISQNWTESLGDGGIVRRERSGDTIGRALRGVYGHTPLPEDMQRLLALIDGADRRC